MYGFVRIGAGIPVVSVADPDANRIEIEKIITKADSEKVDVLVFPELSLTGYTCGDLFFQDSLLKSAVKNLQKLKDFTKNLDMLVAVGLPVAYRGDLYNCAAILNKGKILGLVPKIYLPNYNEFYENRWFRSGKESGHCAAVPELDNAIIESKMIFETESDAKIAVEICEDLWAPTPPSTNHALRGADIILNLSASNELSTKANYRRELVKSHSARTYTTYVYANSGWGESTTDLVFSGHSLICEKGTILAESKSFQKDSQLIFADTDTEMLAKERLKINTYQRECIHEYFFENCELNTDRKRNLVRDIPALPFVPSENKSERCEEIFNIQVSGLAKRFDFTKSKKAVIGISGGLDSTLALLVTVKAFDFLEKDRSNILGFTMPGFGTTDRTYSNALALMDALGITKKEINITKAALQHFADIGHDPKVLDTTYENTQARERTQILMDIANKESALVVGTGDLSEIALGWSTYNGDHMSMYAVNCGVPKTLMKTMVSWVMGNFDNRVSDILKDILETPVSPELLPPDKLGNIEQKTEDILGPYELHDFFLYYVMRFGFEPKKILFLAKEAFKEKYSESEILNRLKFFYKRFFTQQFKRSCIPDGPKVGSVALSPRGDLKMPSDASYNIWLKELEEAEGSICRTN